MTENFKAGEEVYHKSLGKGIFIRYDLHDNESVVEFTDEHGYKDELRVSTSLLNRPTYVGKMKAKE